MKHKKTTRESRTKKPTPMEQAISVIAWVTRNVPEDCRKQSGPTPLAQCLWYAAYQDAEVLAEQTTKHLAQALQDGMGPYKTMKHFADWLDGALGCQTKDEIQLGMSSFWEKEET